MTQGDITHTKVVATPDDPDYDVSKDEWNAVHSIAGGTWRTDQIPSLPATKITSGVFDVARIPDLAASKITSGVLDVATIPDLTRSKITDFFDGPFWSNIPDTPSSFTPTAHGDEAHTLSYSTIGHEHAGEDITSGTISITYIPEMDWDHIDSIFPKTIADLLSDHDIDAHPWTWSLDQIPSLPASQITSGTLDPSIGGLGKTLSPTWTDDHVLVYKSATDQWEMAARTAPGAHATEHESGGSDVITGVITPSTIVFGGDVSIDRSAANILRINDRTIVRGSYDNLTVQPDDDDNPTWSAIRVLDAAGTVHQFSIWKNGALCWGSTGDVNLYRGDDDQLKTDDDIAIGSNIVLSAGSGQPWIYMKNSTGPMERFFDNWTDRLALRLATSGDFFTMESSVGTEFYRIDRSGNITKSGEINNLENVIAEEDLSGASYVDFSDLDINSYRYFKIVFNIKATTNTMVNIFVNGDTTKSNYYTQTSVLDGASVSSARYNEPYITGIPGALEAVGYIYVFLGQDGYPCWLSKSLVKAASAIREDTDSGKKTGTVANITSIRIAPDDGTITGKIMILGVK